MWFGNTKDEKEDGIICFSVERCIVCGEEVPEGTQVCKYCRERVIEHKHREVNNIVKFRI
jgi:predicted nucleic acid-binding Zn ribbon protein